LKEKRRFIFCIARIDFIYNKTKKIISIPPGSVGVIKEGKPNERVKVIFLNILHTKSWFFLIADFCRFFLDLLATEMKLGVRIPRLEPKHFEIWLDPHEYDYCNPYLVRDIKQNNSQLTKKIMGTILRTQ